LSWLITGKASPMPAATVSNNNDWVFMEESPSILSWGPTMFRPIRLTPQARFGVPYKTPANARAAVARVLQHQPVATSVRSYQGVLYASASVLHLTRKHTQRIRPLPIQFHIPLALLAPEKRRTDL
jgi:hypothetical protein